MTIAALLKAGYGDRMLTGKYQVLDLQPDFTCDDLPQTVEMILARVQARF